MVASLLRGGCTALAVTASATTTQSWACCIISVTENPAIPACTFILVFATQKWTRPPPPMAHFLQAAYQTMMAQQQNIMSPCLECKHQKNACKATAFKFRPFHSITPSLSCSKIFVRLASLPCSDSNQHPSSHTFVVAVQQQMPAALSIGCQRQLTTDTD